MKKDKQNKGVNPLLFMMIWFVVLLMTFLSFWFAAAQDEGVLPKGAVYNLLADAFWIFRFPTHTLFWNIILNNYLFFPGLILNTVIDSIVLFILFKVVMYQVRLIKFL